MVSRVMLEVEGFDSTLHTCTASRECRFMLGEVCSSSSSSSSCTGSSSSRRCRRWRTGIVALLECARPDLGATSLALVDAQEEAVEAPRLRGMYC